MSTVEQKQETAIAANSKPRSMKDWLNDPRARDEIAKVVPKHLTPERQLRIALNAMGRVPKLQDCTPESVMRCLLDCSSWGLEPDGRHAHLIPYGKECTLILDYKGIVALAYRSGTVKKIHADIVYEGDIFVYNLGEVKQHEPWDYQSVDLRPDSKGKVRAAYCIITMRDGIEKHEVMSFDEIESIRKRSKAGTSGPWVSDFNEMAKKTVFRRASKWLELSAEQRDAFERDDDKLIDAVSVRVTQSLTKAALPAIAPIVESEE